VTIVFFTSRALPGDPAENLLGPGFANQESLRQIRRAYGLDRPWIVQYGIFLGRILRGDLGQCIRSGQPVLQEILARLPVTLKLAGLALLLACALGIPAGMWLVYSHGRAMAFLGLVAIAMLNAIPLFVLALVFLFFSVRWLPGFRVIPENDWRALLLPAIVLGLGLSGYVARMVRNRLLQESRSFSLLALHAYGVPRFLIWSRHLARNAAIPLITLFGLLLGYLLAGNILIENIFSLPGLGQLLVAAVLSRDYPLVQGTVLIIAGLFLLLNAVVDACYPLLDPRTRLRVELPEQP
jgi:ABC-type dipeptide/oligopeptide/nickel transport system permease component